MGVPCAKSGAPVAIASAITVDFRTDWIDMHSSLGGLGCG
jgi:hypothetical protein